MTVKPLSTTSKSAITTPSTNSAKSSTKIKPSSSTSRPSSSKPSTTKPIASSIDWRYDVCMQPVKAQGNCGACWAFATTALVEFNFCQFSSRKKPVSLSAQQLVDCVTANSGCNGGWQDVTLKYIAAAGGINTESSYPYTSTGGTSGKCKYNPVKNGAAVSASNPVTYIKSGDVKTMMSVLSNKGLVTVVISIVSSFMSYSSGVYVEFKCNKNVIGGHAMTIVGYSTYSAGVQVE